MFQSATFKLTTWYAVIIITISLLFSVLIYVLAATTIETQLDNYLQDASKFSYVDQTLDYLRVFQVRRAEADLVGALVITNLVIWLAGGVGSYYLAKHTLRPIEEVHEAQSRFTSDASHELRTPLASMKVELEVALRDPKLSKGEMRELLSSNLEEVNKLTQLSQTLLQLSQLDHDNIPRESVPLPKVARVVIARFNADSRINLGASSKVPNIFANELNVEELFTILIDNALKYSPKNSIIHVRFIQQKNMAGFEVRNEGEGIAPEALPHIFDRFYQADQSRTGNAKRGYGLGLSLAKKIVELHSGELSVTSAPKQETIFRVLLPKVSKKQGKEDLSE